ncbi:hypothetical protein FB451DRAFT_1410461 [Mycena latifolia]|nr:hypothetical protein FB451DRAFT_1410461 [Mycena latifolia]
MSADAVQKIGIPEARAPSAIDPPRPGLDGQARRRAWLGLGLSGLGLAGLGLEAEPVTSLIVDSTPIDATITVPIPATPPRLRPCQPRPCAHAAGVRRATQRTPPPRARARTTPQGTSRSWRGAVRRHSGSAGSGTATDPLQTLRCGKVYCREHIEDVRPFLSLFNSSFSAVAHTSVVALLPRLHGPLPRVRRAVRPPRRGWTPPRAAELPRIVAHDIARASCGATTSLWAACLHRVRVVSILPDLNPDTATGRHYAVLELLPLLAVLSERGQAFVSPAAEGPRP